MFVPVLLLGSFLLPLSKASAESKAVSVGYQYSLPGNIRCAKVDGQRLYTTGDDGYFRIFDISDAATPVQLGELSGIANASAADVAHGHAYVAAWGTSVAVINVADPTAPSLVTTMGTPGTVNAVKVTDDHLYIAAGYGGVLVYTLEDPASPVRIGRYVSGGYAVSMDIGGSKMYVADYSTRLRIVDISDPANPTFYTSITFSVRAQSVVMNDHYVYAMCEGGYLKVVAIGQGGLPSLIGECRTWASGTATTYIPCSLVLSGNSLLVADSQDGFDVVDVTDRTAPEVVASLSLPGQPVAMSANAQYAFVAAQSADVCIIDAHDYLTKLSVLSQIDTAGNALHTQENGGLLLIGDDAGLYLYDVSNPEVPVQISSVPGVGYAASVVRYGDYAYFAGMETGIGVVNLADPSAPVLEGLVAVPDAAVDLSLSGAYLIAAARASGVLVYSLANPQSPALVGQYNTAGSSLGISVVGTRAYVADGSHGIVILDLVRPTSPMLLGTLTGLGSVVKAIPSGYYLYAISESDGLYVIDATVPSKMTAIGHCPTPNVVKTTGDSYPPFSVAVSGDYVLVGDGDSGVQVIDVKDKTDPYIVDWLDLGSACWGLDISGKHTFASATTGGVFVLDTSAYTSGLNIAAQFDNYGSGYTIGVKVQGNLLFQCDGPAGLGIIDISDPLRPTELGRLTNSSWIVYHVDLYSHYAYLAARDAGIVIADIADPSNPQVLLTLNTPDCATDVLVSGNRLYVADRIGGLLTFDLSAPANPVLLSIFDTPSVASDEFLGLDAVDNLVYVANYWRGLLVVDMTDPYNPVQAGLLSTSYYLWDVRVLESYAYVVGEGSGLQIINCADPANMFVAGSAYTPDERLALADGPPLALSLSGNYAFVGDGLSGLQVVDISDPTLPRVVDSIHLPGYAWGVAIRDSYAYVGALFEGVFVIDAETYLQPAATIQTLTLTSPNGGEQWYPGAGYAITWQPRNEIGSQVKIKLFKGGIFNSWISGPTPDDGACIWTVPSTLISASDYTVQIYCASDFSSIDLSDAPFSIIPASLRITSPNGGEQWRLGSAQTITWQSNASAIAQVKIKLFKNGVFNRWISGPVTNTGSFVWRVPSDVPIGTGYTVQVYSASDFSIIDNSDAPFSIVASPLTITSPNGGESWATGSTHTITWQSTSAVGTKIKIKLFKSGIFNRWISGPTDNDGAFAWTIPSDLAVASNYTVQAYSATDFTIIDFSDAPFTIVSGG